MNYKLSEGYFSSFDNTKLYYRYYSHLEPRGVLILLHGHGEHIGRYEKYTRYLPESGLSLALFDGRGYGRSEGFPCYVKSYDDFVRDVQSFVNFLESQDKISKKFFLFGHSNGALTAILWAMQHFDCLDGLFLSSPYLGIKLPGFLIGLNVIIDKIYPKFTYANPIYPPYLTHNPDEVDYYKKDKLIQRKITAHLVIEMMRSHRKLEEILKFRFPFPVYILMSGLDKVVDMSKTRDFYAKLDVPEKELQVFPEMYHEIFNELGQERVFEALKSQLTSAWLWKTRQSEGLQSS